MRQDSRLSRLLHVLLHMQDFDGPITSEVIGRMIGSNPALVRRIMSGLRDAGYVASGKGQGGGWTLRVPLSDITLLDVYRALGEPELFAFGLSDENPHCLVEQAVNDAVRDTIAEARRTLLTRFADIRLSDIADDFEHRFRDMATRNNGCSV